jgi:hypothetical protein
MIQSSQRNQCCVHDAYACVTSCAHVRHVCARVPVLTCVCACVCVCVCVCVCLRERIFILAQLNVSPRSHNDFMCARFSASLHVLLSSVFFVCVCGGGGMDVRACMHAGMYATI